jgi:hypothetical protein
MPVRADTPLWAAAHLPLKGGDHARHVRPKSCNGVKWGTASRRVISPLEGEMSGRTEGGNRTLHAEKLRAEKLHAA